MLTSGSLKNSALRVIGAGAAAIFILVPMLYSTNVERSLTTPKVIFFQVVVEIIFALWLALAVIYPEYRLRFTPIVGAVAFLAAALVATAILGVCLKCSLYDTYSSKAGIILMLHASAFFLTLTSLARHLSWRFLAEIIAATSIVLSLVAIVQRFSSSVFSIPPPYAFERTAGIFANAPFFAGYLIFTIFISIWLWANSKSGLWRAVFGASAVLGTIALFLTETRGALLGFGVGIMLLVLWFGFTRRALWQGRAVLASLLLLISAVWLTRTTVPWQAVPGLNRFLSSSSRENLGQRIIFWKIAWRGFKEKPLTGWGFNNFNVVFNKFYDPEQYREATYVFQGTPNKPYNTVFEYLVGSGIFGLVGYLTVFVAAGYALLKRRPAGSPEVQDEERGTRPILIAMLAAYLVQNFAIWDTIATLPFFAFILAFIDARYKKIIPDRKLARAPYAPLIFAPAALFALTLVAIPVYFINGRTALAEYHAHWAENYRDHGQIKKAAEEWERVFAAHSPYEDELFSAYWSTVREYVLDGDLPSDWLTRREDIIAGLTRSVTDYPYDYRYKLELAEAYLAFYKKNPSYVDAADALLTKISRLKPINAPVYLERAKIAIVRKNIAAAERDIEQALELNPALGGKHILLSIAAYKVGDAHTGSRELAVAEANGEKPADYKQALVLADLVGDMGHNYAKAIEMYTAALASETRGDSHWINLKIRLGIAYFLNHENERSRQSFSEVSELLSSDFWDLKYLQPIFIKLRLLP